MFDIVDNLHWKKYYERHWSACAALLNNEPMNESNYRKLLIMHAKKLNVIGDEELTKSIKSIKAPATTYHQYVGKRRIRQAFAFATIDSSKSIKIFTHGQGYAGKTCLIYRIANNYYPKEYAYV